MPSRVMSIVVFIINICKPHYLILPSKHIKPPPFGRVGVGVGCYCCEFFITTATVFSLKYCSDMYTSPP